jgi:hypothetical protein
MSNGPLLKSQSSSGVRPPASRRATGAKRKHRRHIVMYFGVFAVAVSIAAVVAISIEIGVAPSKVVENSASSAETNSVGNIVLHPGTTGCQSMTFNNQTGQVSEAPTPCRDGIVLDAKGVPIPMGTVHTLNSISKSFK